MTVEELIQLRLVNQGLTSAAFETSAGVVSHFGAIQSQDYAMAKWAIGMRVRQVSALDIERCVNSGAIIRTHILRPTWHFVACSDVRWMMELSAPNVRKATRYVDKQVGLTDEIFKKAWRIIESELEREDNLTKEDLMDRLAKNQIKISSLMATQIIIRAELEMRLCSGVRKEKKVTYSLFDRRVPSSEKISDKDALVKLASVYFNSRGPATIKDFTWWSGMSVSDAKFAVSGLGKNLKGLSIDGLNYLYFENIDYPKKKISALLPPYDEYMVGYAESRNVAFPHGIDKSLLGNGIFKPVVLCDNAIVGTWRKTSKEPFVEVQYLNSNRSHKSINSELEAFKLFLQK